MTPRPIARTRRAALASLIAGAGLLALPGCDPRTLLFFLQPFDPTIPAPGPSLKGKKVVVLAHVKPGVGTEYADLPRELTREFVLALRKNVKRIEVVDPDKVNGWAEAHPSWTDAAECAKAFEADLAIMLDVSEFATENPKSPDMMEGISSVHIQVMELAHPKNSRGGENKSQPKESTQIYEDQLDTTFPVRGAVHRDSGVSAASFRIKFLKLVATEVSWHFIDHAPGDDIQDVKFSPSDRS